MLRFLPHLSSPQYKPPPPWGAQGWGGGAGIQWKRGSPPASLEGTQPMPSHCPPDAKCQPQWHLQPTVTTPNRFGNLLRSAA